MSTPLPPGLLPSLPYYTIREDIEEYLNKDPRLRGLSKDELCKRLNEYLDDNSGRVTDDAKAYVRERLKDLEEKGTLW